MCPCIFDFLKYLLASQKFYGGALVSTYGLKHRRHAEDDALASLKDRINQINADYEDLALAA